MPSNQQPRENNHCLRRQRAHQQHKISTSLQLSKPSKPSAKTRSPPWSLRNASSPASIATTRHSTPTLPNPRRSPLTSQKGRQSPRQIPGRIPRCPLQHKRKFRRSWPSRHVGFPAVQRRQSASKLRRGDVLVQLHRFRCQAWRTHSESMKTAAERLLREACSIVIPIVRCRSGQRCPGRPERRGSTVPCPRRLDARHAPPSWPSKRL